MKSTYSTCRCSPDGGAYALLFFDENNEKAFVAIVGILHSDPWAHVVTSFKNYTNLQDLLVSECYNREEYMRIDPCDRVTGDLLWNKSVEIAIGAFSILDS